MTRHQDELFEISKEKEKRRHQLDLLLSLPQFRDLETTEQKRRRKLADFPWMIWALRPLGLLLFPIYYLLPQRTKHEKAALEEEEFLEQLQDSIVGDARPDSERLEAGKLEGN